MRLRLVSLFVIAMAVGGMAPAAAIEAATMVQPQANATLVGPFTLSASVDAADGELVQNVRVSLSGASNRSWSLTADGPPDGQGRQRWSLAVDPLTADAVIRNGPHGLTARATSFAGATTESALRPVRLRVPVVSPLTARPSRQNAQMVLLTWDRVVLPDFLAYRIQRKPDTQSAAWVTINQVADASVSEASDTVETAGSYRYRLVVARSDGEGAEVLGASPPRGVRADPADPGTFDPPADPALTGAQPGDASGGSSGDGTGSTGSTGGPQGRPGQIAQADTGGTPGGAETGTATTPVQPTSSPQVTVLPPPQAPVTAPPVAAPVPLNDGVFEPLLPVGATETELTIRETEAAFQDGSLRPGGTVAILTEQRVDRGILVSGATGLLLIVVAGHVRRFLADTP